MTKLDKGTVIAAALELLNEVGMDNLTTRKLAERLKVSGDAIQRHAHASSRAARRLDLPATTPDKPMSA